MQFSSIYIHVCTRRTYIYQYRLNACKSERVSGGNDVVWSSGKHIKIQPLIKRFSLFSSSSKCEKHYNIIYMIHTSRVHTSAKIGYLHMYKTYTQYPVWTYRKFALATTRQFVKSLSWYLLYISVCILYVHFSNKRNKWRMLVWVYILLYAREHMVYLCVGHVCSVQTT